MPDSFTVSGLVGFLIIMALVGVFWYFIGPFLFKDEKKDASKPAYEHNEPAAYVSTIPTKKDFEIPCTVTIVRFSSFSGALIKLSVVLNGVEVGKLKNGSSMIFPTYLTSNELTFLNPQIKRIPFHFKAESGGNIQITMKSPEAELILKN